MQKELVQKYMKQVLNLELVFYKNTCMLILGIDDLFQDIAENFVTKNSPDSVTKEAQGKVSPAEDQGTSREKEKKCCG